MSNRADQHRGIIHLHSNYSYDSLCRPIEILKFAIKSDMTFVVLTDHETIAGSRRLRELAEEMNIEIEIPLASEYKTNYGDIVAAFIGEEIRTRDFDELVETVRKQGGLTILPHPFVGHSNLDHVATNVDLIEIFNGRQSPELDRLANELAKKHNKPVISGPDSHSVDELGNAIITLDRTAGLKDDLVSNEISCATKGKTARTRILFSNLVGVLKKKQYAKLLKIPGKLLRELFRTN